MLASLQSCCLSGRQRLLIFFPTYFCVRHLCLCLRVRRPLCAGEGVFSDTLVSGSMEPQGRTTPLVEAIRSKMTAFILQEVAPLTWEGFLVGTRVGSGAAPEIVPLVVNAAGRLTPPCVCAPACVHLRVCTCVCAPACVFACCVRACA